ncbi:MAG: hypothetical protein IPG96_03020 [Proteobacteria bacterium]|nr:hypothetical protein [Pseudomonadota bacterium]
MLRLEALLGRPVARAQPRAKTDHGVGQAVVRQLAGDAQRDARRLGQLVDRHVVERLDRGLDLLERDAHLARKARDRGADIAGAGRMPEAQQGLS